MAVPAHLSSDPALETCRVYTVYHGDIVEVDVGHIGRLGLVGTERANAHAVGLVADGAALEEHVASA